MNSRLYDAEAFDASHIFCDFDLTHRILVLSGKHEMSADYFAIVFT